MSNGDMQEAGMEILETIQEYTNLETTLRSTNMMAGYMKQDDDHIGDFRKRF